MDAAVELLYAKHIRQAVGIHNEFMQTCIGSTEQNQPAVLYVECEMIYP